MPGAAAKPERNQGRPQLAGLAAIEGAISAAHASIEAWPKPHPRERVADADVTTYTVAPGATLQVGGKTLRVDRLQAAAGEVLGFVEFQTRP